MLNTFKKFLWLILENFNYIGNGGGSPIIFRHNIVSKKLDKRAYYGV